MPGGKPAGVRCIQLDAANACKIFGSPQRPAVCSQLMPSDEMCGAGREHAMVYLSQLEALTAPTLAFPPLNRTCVAHW
jgi:hypothetical protein